jgi:hypothetical protein
VRDPVNELYDEACNLLEAAQRLRRAAARPGAWEAVAPAAACAQEAAHELRAAFEALHRDLQRAAAGAQALDPAFDALDRELLAVEEGLDEVRSAYAASASR